MECSTESASSQDTLFAQMGDRKILFTATVEIRSHFSETKIQSSDHTHFAAAIFIGSHYPNPPSLLLIAISIGRVSQKASESIKNDKRLGDCVCMGGISLSTPDWTIRWWRVGDRWQIGYVHPIVHTWSEHLKHYICKLMLHINFLQISNFLEDKNPKDEDKNVT